MKRIISIFELFVLVIFCDLSVANPPMFSGCGFSSSTAVEESSSGKPSEPCIYGLESLTRVNPPANRRFQNPRIYIENYHDADQFKYKLLGAYDELAFENTGLDTYLLFYFGKWMKIRAVDNIDVLYSLNFEVASEANLVADYVLSADSARYKKCTGRDAYKLEKLYKNATPNTPASVEEKLCVFKLRQTIATTFVIRRMAPKDDQPFTVCVFRSIDYSLTKLRDEDTKSELRVYAYGVRMQPIYVLETPRPEKLQEFFRSK